MVRVTSILTIMNLTAWTYEMIVMIIDDQVFSVAEAFETLKLRCMATPPCFMSFLKGNSNMTLTFSPLRV